MSTWDRMIAQLLGGQLFHSFSKKQLRHAPKRVLVEFDDGNFRDKTQYDVCIPKKAGDPVPFRSYAVHDRERRAKGFITVGGSHVNGIA